MKRSRPVVAIDGPAGAGKTTVTRRVAEALEFTLVDTGALYRAVALAAQRQGASWEDSAAVGEVAAQLAQANRIRFDAAGVLLLDDEDISQLIRTQSIADGASKVSAIPAVREALLEMQRAQGRAGGVVLEGRDIGTVVFPDAEAKFFLTASVAVRAARRYAELCSKGVQTTLQAVEDEVVARDARDTTRPVAPLRQADDAILVDSSDTDIDGVVEQIVDRVRQVEAALGAGKR
jgi:cytidylate kinase